MQKGFVRGMLIGGMVGASIGAMMNPDASKKSRRMLRKGRMLLKKSGTIIDDISDLFR